MKNINANTLIEWFSKSFDADIIYLVRHPIPAALSAIKRNWGNMAKDYLESEKFRRIHLDSGMVDFGWQTLKHGTQLQRYVLEWCLENLYPLQLSKDQPWLTLSYEELVFRPKEISRLICSRFGLPDSERMYKVVFSPSRTTTQKSKHNIRKKGPSALVHEWIPELDPTGYAGAGEVLKAFGVWAYMAESPWPHPKLCHFGPLRDE
ncbi:MAG: sulfotransferase [Desulfobacterales bacterium]